MTEPDGLALTVLLYPAGEPDVMRIVHPGARPAVKKAMAMGPEFREDPASISSDEQARRRKLVGDQRAQPIPSEWIRSAQA